MMENVFNQVTALISSSSIFCYSLFAPGSLLGVTSMSSLYLIMSALMVNTTFNPYFAYPVSVCVPITDRKLFFSCRETFSE